MRNKLTNQLIAIQSKINSLHRRPIIRYFIVILLVASTLLLYHPLKLVIVQEKIPNIYFYVNISQILVETGFLRVFVRLGFR